MKPQVTIHCPSDWHVHLRQGENLPDYCKASWDAGFHRLLVMPNTVPPITDVASWEAYKKAIAGVLPHCRIEGAFKLTAGQTAAQVGSLNAAGLLAGKYYPAGATTNSAGGIRHWSEIEEALAAMESLDMVLSVHAEEPDGPGLTREHRFLPHLDEIRDRFPKLRIVMEHVSTKEGIDWVKAAGERIAATITAHHLLYSRETEIQPREEPHFFCRPLIQNEANRQALEDVVLSGNDQFFFGSDSAPHLLENKDPQCPGGPLPGVFSAPVALALLAEFFYSRKAMDLFEPFASFYGARFYGVDASCDLLVLERESQMIPKLCGGARPFLAGESVPWRVLVRPASL